jgi:hypothetical protein
MDIVLTCLCFPAILVIFFIELSIVERVRDGRLPWGTFVVLCVVFQAMTSLCVIQIARTTMALEEPTGEPLKTDIERIRANASLYGTVLGCMAPDTGRPDFYLCSVGVQTSLSCRLDGCIRTP